MNQVNLSARSYEFDGNSTASSNTRGLARTGPVGGGSLLHGLRLATIARIMGVVVIVGYIASIGTAMYALRELKVGGPVYETVVTIKDLVADILPPPEYVIEAYLEATLAQQDPTSVAVRTERLVQLHKVYDERKAYWSEKNIDARVKKKLTQESDSHVTQFWVAIEKDMLPLLARGDTAGARAAYTRVQEAYNAHRAVIDALVKDTERLTTESETYSVARATTLQTITWVVSGIILALIAAGAAGIVHGLVRPVTRMTGAMEVLARGNLDTEIPYTERSDEIGAMANALQVFKSNGQQMETMRHEQEKAAIKAAADSKLARVNMADQFEAKVMDVVRTVASAARELEHTANLMSATVLQVNSQAEAVGSSAQTASMNVQMVSAAAEELSASISEISRQVNDAAGISNAATQETKKAAQTAGTLATIANQIDNVVGLISDIAEQTNLLALNATIEAARAGEAGKGFAVVASEVKALASQTAKATQEISSQLSGVKNGTGQVVSAIDTVGGIIERVRAISASIAGGVTEQGVATADIARNVQEAADGTRRVSETISGVTEAANATGRSTEQVLRAAQDLSKNAERLQTDVTQFLASVRAA